MTALKKYFVVARKKFSYENNGFLKILDGRILVRVSAHFNFSLLLKKIYFSKKTSQELRMLSRSKNHKKRMFTKMLDVGRGGRYTYEETKSQFKCHNICVLEEIGSF